MRRDQDPGIWDERRAADIIHIAWGSSLSKKAIHSVE